MSGEAMIERRRGERGRDFPEKTNPNRAVIGGPGTPETPGGARSYPERCNPNRRRSPLTDEQRRLASEYMPLASAMVRRSGYSALDRDELKSAAYVALVEAAQTFDPSKNVNFATFARHRIRGALSDFRRSWLGLSRGRGDGVPAPRFCRLSLRDDVQDGAIAAMASPPDGSDLEEAEHLESYFRRLPKAQASACRLIYLDGKSQDEAAAVLGYSKAYLSRLHKDALESLSREYADVASLRAKSRGEAWN